MIGALVALALFQAQPQLVLTELKGSYADRSDSSYPAGTPAGIELAASTAARAQEAGTDAATELLELDTGADETADILLDESEGLT